MNSSQEQWLVINNTIKKLKHLSHWLTSVDPEKKHVTKAIKELEQAKRLLEEK
tara:strand:+ start:25006 stop:25164 length:159 start_codon:yes stop_codon:yes gene_type:complete